MSSTRPITSLRATRRPLIKAPRLACLQARTNVTVPFRLPAARNEPNPTYKEGSEERIELVKELKRLRSQLPLKSEIFLNGTSQPSVGSWDQPVPAEKDTVFTNYPLISKEQVSNAITSALEAKKTWEKTPFVDRAP